MSGYDARMADQQFAGVWTHDDVERRLREAMTTLRRIPMHVNGLPKGDRANWPCRPHRRTGSHGLSRDHRAKGIAKPDTQGGAGE